MDAAPPFSRITVCVFVAALLIAGSVSGHTVAEKKAYLKKIADASAKIPAHDRPFLSAGARNFLKIAASASSTYRKAGTADDGGLTSLPPPPGFSVSHSRSLVAATSAGPGGTIVVSNPGLDFLTSVVEGFTQSESSSAWCGDAVVAGYNDSGAFLRTAGVDFLGAWSFNGISVSANGGKTFKDLAFLNPGTDPLNFLSGDPVVTCSSPTEFYYASIFSTATPPDSLGNRLPLSAISVSSSSNSGISWGAPIAAVAKDGFTHQLDKPWMALDPTNPQRMYVSYTDFDSTFGPTGPCANDFRIAIEIVRSTDGGNTWSPPVVIHEECGASLNGVQGSNMVVSPVGKLYLAYEFIPGLTPNNEIRFVHSLDGKTFSKTVVVTNAVVPNGAGGTLQGGFRNNEFPQLAVDRSNGPGRGTVYVTWSDGRDNVVPDLGSPTGTYAYPDVFIAKSIDFGLSFNRPHAVSPTPGDFTGTGRDQFFPGIAVDKDGDVGVCYYDRRNSPDNTGIDRYCSVSRNHGVGWAEQRVSFSNWLPIHSSDAVINSTYIGDYDALTSDFLLGSDGFFGTFEIQTLGNPDIYARKFR